MPGATQSSIDAPSSDGIGIAFQSLGGNGPNALLIHGFGSDRMSWLANQPAIETVATVSALDLPGHGASSMDVGDGKLTTLADRIATLIESRGYPELHLIGHSLGGAIALMLAASRPDLVTSLVLIAPAGLGQAVDPSFLSAFPALSEPDETEALLQRLVVRPRLIGKPLVALIVEQLSRPGARQALRLIAEGLTLGASALDAAVIDVVESGIPRLVIWGKDDTINPISLEKLAAFGGEVRFVAGAAHLPHIENPRLVNAEIIAFLTQVSSLDR
jgi:pimeloyl-ACP methyl ester carboxylesterase